MPKATVLLVASPRNNRPSIRARNEEGREVLKRFPGDFDGRQFYWAHIGPSSEDLLELREQAEVRFHLDIALSPQPLDIYMELKAASRLWDFWPEKMRIGEYQPSGASIRARLPEEAARARSEKHINLAKRIVGELVEDGVDLDADVEYDPSLTPSHVRHIRGVADMESRMPSERDGGDLAYTRKKFDVGKDEIRDAVEGKGPYREIEGKREILA